MARWLPAVGRSVAAKCRYVLAHKLAGVMFWQLEADSSGKLLGLLSLRDLLHGQMEELKRQLDSLEEYVASEGPGVIRARD